MNAKQVVDCFDIAEPVSAVAVADGDAGEGVVAGLDIAHEEEAFGAGDTGASIGVGLGLGDVEVALAERGSQDNPVAPSWPLSTSAICETSLKQTPVVVLWETWRLVKALAAEVKVLTCGRPLVSYKRLAGQWHLINRAMGCVIAPEGGAP